ncbi:MAG: HesA/MoeB/ThiF family protein [Bacillota bacterium]
MGSLSINNDVLRYSRQIILEGFGRDGQQKLRKAKVLVVGAGGLGSPVLLYLAAAGVGNIGIVDFDSVTVSNLNRQVIHFTNDIGSRKTDSAEKKIKRLNPEINVIKHNTKISIDNAEEIITGYDVVVDATDNFTARYIVSDCCFFLKKSLVEGAATGYEGIIMTIIPGKTPCYRCLYPKPPEDGVIPTCNDTGILGAITGVIGSLQALEVIKMLTGLGELVAWKLLTYDLMSAGFREIKWKKRDNCPLCGKEPVIKELDQYNIKCRLKEI